MAATQISEIKQFRIDSILKSIPFLACLSEKELDEFKHFIFRKRFSKNEVILLEEDTPNYMYVVYSGKVKAVKINCDGKEKILAIHKEGDFFGEMAPLDGKTSPATVIAMENAEVGLISKTDFERYLLKNIKVLRAIISMLCSRLREAWGMLKALSFSDAERKVRSALWLISVKYGRKSEKGIIIALKVTHQDIADYASVSRETVTRILNNFSKIGEIEVSANRNIILRPSFLEKTPFL